MTTYRALTAQLLGTTLVALAVAGCGGSAGHHATSEHTLPAVSRPITRSTGTPTASDPATAITAASAATTGTTATSAAGTATSAAALPTPHVTRAPGTAYNTIAAYFDAINRKEWPTVWALGGKNLNASYASMIQGYAHTANDDVHPYSVVGGTVKLVLLARSDTGATSLYTGTYTVNSSMITRGSLSLAAQINDSTAAIGTLAAEWFGHGRGISITAGGVGVLSYRAYVDCAQTSSTPCDDLVGNEIIDGGLAIFRITAVDGDTALATTLFSSDARTEPLTMKLQPKAGTFTVNGFDVPFCDPAAEDRGVCGA